jgi:glycosyltransferase involved in cell wall biosynthesis
MQHAIEAQRSEGGTLNWKWSMAERRGSSEIDVSIIVANYNGDRFVADAIRSACNQSLRSIEIIVVDDASTDFSLQIIKSLAEEDGRIRLIESSVNGGAAAARNRALDVAKGRWIGILDSDDLMHPDRLLWLIKEGTKSNADIVADDLLLFDTDRRAAPQTLFVGRWTKAAHWVSAQEYLATNNFYENGPALGYLKPVFRSSLIDKHKVRYDERLTIAEDYNFVFQLLMAGAKFLTIPQVGYFYRRHSGSISHRLNSVALRSILNVENGWAQTWPQASLQPLFRARERSIRRAIAFDALVQAIKSREIAKAGMTAIANPRAAWLLRLPLVQFIKRLDRDAKPAKGERGQVCILTHQFILSRNKDNSRSLLDVADLLVRRGFDVHLVILAPAAIGTWPFLKLPRDMAIFKSVKFQGAARLGNYVIAGDLGLAFKSVLCRLNQHLFRKRLNSFPLSGSASDAIGQVLTRENGLFIAQEAPSIADILIADGCFLTGAFPYALRPDARRIVLAHNSFSRCSPQFAVDNASNSAISVSLAEEINMVGQADHHCGNATGKSSDASK